MMTETQALVIVSAAVAERRAAEMLDCLFNGGGVTVSDGQLVLLPADLLTALAAHPTHPDQGRWQCAGYLAAVWDYAVHRNGAVLVGSMERPYRDVFAKALHDYGLGPDDAAWLTAHGVVTPRGWPS